jgi:hypothetical protein
MSYGTTSITAAQFAAVALIAPVMIQNQAYNKGFATRYKISNGAGALKPIYFRIPLARLCNIHKHIETVYRVLDMQFVCNASQVMQMAATLSSVLNKGDSNHSLTYPLNQVYICAV